MQRELICADDARSEARRQIPRFAFDYLDGGAGAECGLAENRHSLDTIRLIPRVLGGNILRDTGTSILGQDFALPFGVAPIGLNNLSWPKADVGIAQAAARSQIPFILSTAGTMSLEAAAQIAGPYAWFQLYVGSDAGIVDDLVLRAETAGISRLVVTVDLPAPGKRRRDLRNGFTLPLRWTPDKIAQLLARPRWSLATLRHGAPAFANLSPYRDARSSQTLAQLMAAQSSARLDWEEVGRLRDRWKGKLIVKGILHPDDARRAFATGMDAIIVSNHGGRQIDAAISAATMLPHIRAAVGPDACVMMDGGIRTGEDIVRAVALGADFVFLGRPFPFAAAARGTSRGPGELIALLEDELDRAMACCGVGAIRQIATANLLRTPTA